MFGFGMPEIITMGVVVLFFSFLSAMKRKGNIQISGPTLVLRRFTINRDPQSETAEVISIAGRVSGLVAYIYTTIGIDAETTLVVSGGELRIKSSSLFGQQHHVVPMKNISSVHCGYIKPIGYLIVSVLFLLSGLFALSKGQWGAFLFALTISALLGVSYWLLQRIGITINTKGGVWIGIAFKRSIIENVPVDIEHAKLAIALINNMAISSQGGVPEISKVLAESIKASGTETKQNQEGICTHCGQVMEKGAKFCTACGRNA